MRQDPCDQARWRHRNRDDDDDEHSRRRPSQGHRYREASGPAMSACCSVVSEPGAATVTPGVRAGGEPAQRRLPGPANGPAGVDADNHLPGGVRRLAHEPLGWRPTTLAVTVRRYRCPGCGPSPTKNAIVAWRSLPMLPGRWTSPWSSATPTPRARTRAFASPTCSTTRCSIAAPCSLESSPPAERTRAMRR